MRRAADSGSGEVAAASGVGTNDTTSLPFYRGQGERNEQMVEPFSCRRDRHAWRFGQRRRHVGRIGLVRLGVEPELVRRMLRTTALVLRRHLGRFLQPRPLLQAEVPPGVLPQADVLPPALLPEAGLLCPGPRVPADLLPAAMRSARPLPRVVLPRAEL